MSESSWLDFDLELNTTAVAQDSPVAAAAHAEIAVEHPRPTRKSRRAPQRRCLYIDIETVPDESRLELFGLPPLPEVQAETPRDGCPAVASVIGGTIDQIAETLRRVNPDGNWLSELMTAESHREKPRAGVRQAIEKLLSERREIAGAADERRKLLSVTPEFCRVVALGWAVGGDRSESLTWGENAEHSARSEAVLLNEFWRLAGLYSPIVGYNVAGFDLPVLFTRSSLHGISPTKLIDLRPWGQDVVDLMALRYAKSKAAKLKDLAKWMGIAVPADGVDGSQVHQLWQENPAKLGEYVRSDVEVTRALHEKFSGYWCA